MKIEELRHYGDAFSDAESAWPPELKARMNRLALKVVFGSLGLAETARFVVRLAAETRRIAAVDLSEIRARGMTNEAFIATQRKVAALYSALERTLGYDRAQAIMNEIMDRTAPEALALCFPTVASLLTFDDPLAAFKAFFAPVPEVSRRAGCHTVEVVEDTEDTFQYDMTSCVWYDLATAFGVPQACLPNCYSDDLFLPGYFRALGLAYSRKGTIARGDGRCDFRLERIQRPPGADRR